MWDLGISDTPFTSMPAPSVYLSANNVDLFSKFTEYGKDHSTPDEFLEGLRFYADQGVGDWACRIEELDCTHRVP